MESKARNKHSLTLFFDKVKEKSGWSRSLFISVNGFAPEALEYYGTGRQTNFIVMNGRELSTIMDGKKDLVEILKRKVRTLTEEGRFYFESS